MNVDRPCFAVMSCLDQLWPLGIQQSSVQTRHGQLKDNMHYVDGHIVVVMRIKNKTRHGSSKIQWKFGLEHGHWPATDEALRKASIKKIYLLVADQSVKF